MASFPSRIGRACGDKAKFEDVEGSLRESSKKFGQQSSEANARTGNWLVDTLDGPQVNKGADNYNLKNSETDPWGLPAPTSPGCNIQEHSLFQFPPGNIQERGLLDTREYNHNGAWCAEPSNETQSKTSSPLQREWDSFRSIIATPYKAQGGDVRATSERKGRDTHVSKLEQGRGVKVTEKVNPCASCRIRKFKVIRTPLLVDGPHY